MSFCRVSYLVRVREASMSAKQFEFPSCSKIISHQMTIRHTLNVNAYSSTSPNKTL